METIIATNIETMLFYSTITFLKENDWILIVEYDENIFNKGIYFDFYQFSKNGETISLAWSNWFEGEIKATTKILNEISGHFGLTFKYGEPEYLQRENIIEEMKTLLKFKK